MCYKVACAQCSKPTWAGCGLHIEKALADVRNSFLFIIRFYYYYFYLFIDFNICRFPLQNVAHVLVQNKQEYNDYVCWV